LVGCASSSRAPTIDLTGYEPRAAAPIFDGQSGTPLTWEQMLERVAAADVVILGEQHDDAAGHRVQLAIAADVFERYPGSALSLEMIDRRHQATVDDYLADLIDRDTFYERIASTRWRRTAASYLAGDLKRREFAERIMRLGWPDWEGNYQPIIEAAKAAGARVIAANTPWLLYSSLANKEGFERLDSLTDAQQALFDRPPGELEGPYRERFWEIIAGRAEGEEPPEPEGDGDGEAAGAHGSAAAHGGMTDEQILRMFRGQLVMDATMAGSIADALDNGATKVVHLVGQFHSDFDGGLVQELCRRAPNARILVISMQRRAEAELPEDDAERADLIIHTARFVP
jgi:uncharacterized iron-regulated protein